MSKQEIKKALREAIEKDPDKKDIKKVSLFGSHAYGQPRENSDVDVLIEFEPQAAVGLFEMAGIKNRLTDSIGKRVDLLTPECLSKYFKNDVFKKAELVYEK